MKANELMIGDWVMYNENIFIDDEYEPSVPIKPAQIDSGEDIDLAIEGCYTPIPLTVEILEKNGFERRGGISYHKPNIGLIILHWNDDLCFLNYSKKNIPPIMIPFHYVHELQHALRLCGLNELADNFKV